MATARAQQRPHPSQMRIRSLRIGVILGGKIVEEKLVRKRDNITIGQSAKNTFSIPVEGMPRTWPLFLVKDDRYFLHFSPSMDGRISDGGQVQPLTALRQSAQRHGEGWILPLPDTARGKIVLGDMTLLFQFVTAPPLQPRPHLPASVRGTLADRIDPQLSIIVGVSILLHLGVMLYARCLVDPPLTKAEQIYRDTFPEEYEDTFQPKAVDVDVEVDPDAEATKEDPKEGQDEKPKDKPSTKPSTGDSKPAGTEGSARDSKSDEEMAEEAELAIAQMFGDESDDGSEGTRMSDRNPGNDLAGEAENVEEGRVKVTLKDTGDEDGPSRGVRRRATTSGPNVDTGTGREGSGEVGPAKVPKKPDVKPDGLSSDDDVKNLTPAAILDKIRRQYTYGLKQCFKKVLKIDETASGTVRLKFTIGERGNVTAADTKGFGYDTLDACVASQAKGWRFTPPKDEDGEATSMTVKLSLPFTGK